MKELDTNIRFTHKSLVEKSKAGDRNSQYKLYELYVDAMYNIGLRYLRIKEDAEDIVQESFVDAFRNLHTFKYESTFGAWLKRIVINKSINHLKVKRLALANMDDHDHHLTDEEETVAELPLALEKIKTGIQKLPLGYQQIINLYLLEGYDHMEIGEVLGITTSTSKSQYHRAKKKLVQIINAL